MWCSSRADACQQRSWATILWIKDGFTFQFAFLLVTAHHYVLVSCSDNKLDTHGTPTAWMGHIHFIGAFRRPWPLVIVCLSVCLLVDEPESIPLSCPDFIKSCCHVLTEDCEFESLKEKSVVLLPPQHSSFSGQKSWFQIGGINPVMWVKLKARDLFFANGTKLTFSLGVTFCGSVVWLFATKH